MVVRQPDLGDSGHDLWDADAAHGWFTACWLFATGKTALGSGRWRSVLTRPPMPHRRGRCWHARAGPAGRAGGSGRVHRQRGCAAAGPGARRCHRHRGGGPGTDGARPVPRYRWPRRPLAARVRDRSRRAGARVITDGWQGYQGLEKLGYVHQRRSQRAARTRGEDPGELLPAVHRIASLIKRCLARTGSVDTRT